jgi:hypothetical protein
MPQAVLIQVSNKSRYEFVLETPLALPADGWGDPTPTAGDILLPRDSTSYILTWEFEAEMDTRLTWLCEGGKEVGIHVWWDAGPSQEAPSVELTHIGPVHLKRLYRTSRGGDIWPISCEIHQLPEDLITDCNLGESPRSPSTK